MQGFRFRLVLGLAVADDQHAASNDRAWAGSGALHRQLSGNGADPQVADTAKEQRSILRQCPQSS